MINISKVCPKCNQLKSFIEFSKNKTSKDGLQSKCKLCCSIEFKEWLHKQDIHYYEKYVKKHYKNNNEYYSLNRKKWNEDNKDYVKQYNQDIKIKQRKNKWQKQRKEDPINGPLIKLHQFIINGVHRGIKFTKFNNKDQKSLEIIGLNSWEEFKLYIEKQWDINMNWENYGNNIKNNWSIDHIIPISSATTLEEVKKLNHHTNLRPIWHIDNIRKRDKL